MTEGMPGSNGAIAIIPARGGSKGIPGKNVARVGGQPLIARAVQAALKAACFDRVVVSTDDADILSVAESAGAHVIERPAELAGDQATSESAILHALGVLAGQNATPNTVAFLQATSPFIRSEDLRAAVETVAAGKADVVFSAFETYAFLWSDSEARGATGVNHDPSFRPRRQDRDPHFQETGAFYVFNANGFVAHKHRFFGRVRPQPVDETWAIEVDTPAELARAQRDAAYFRSSDLQVDFDALITDFDGVHTNDTAVVQQDGTESVVVSRSDGLGVAMLTDAGIPMLILSKERNPVVSARAQKLRVEVLQGVDDKLSALLRWATARGIPLERIAYVGNDVNDIACLRRVGWPVVVQDAHPAVRAHARIILRRAGGYGALRELIDLRLNIETPQ